MAAEADEDAILAQASAWSAYDDIEGLFAQSEAEAEADAEAELALAQLMGW